MSPGSSGSRAVFCKGSQRLLSLCPGTRCTAWDELRGDSELWKDGASFISFLVLPQIFCSMTLGSSLISLAIETTSLSHKSQELFTECRAIVFCGYKYTTSC